MSGRSVPAMLPVVVLILLTLTPEAQARRRLPILITTGEKVLEITDIPEDSPVKEMLSDAKIGYRCQHVGLFWMALWTWDGEFCIYSDEKRTLNVATPSVISTLTGVPEGEIKKPLFYTFPPLLVILAAFLAIGLLLKISDARSEARRERASFQRTTSLRHLVSGGIPAPSHATPAGSELPAIPVYGGTAADPSDHFDTDSARNTSSPVPLYTDEELLGLAQRAGDAERETQGASDGAPASDDTPLLDALMDALCCVMVSDRRVSKSERKHVHDVMKIVKCPWSEGEINRRMKNFVSQVKRGEYGRLLDGACNKLKAFRGQGKERLLEASLNAVAKADGIVDEAEKKVCERLMSALSPQAVRKESG